MGIVDYTSDVADSQFVQHDGYVLIISWQEKSTSLFVGFGFLELTGKPRFIRKS